MKFVFMGFLCFIDNLAVLFSVHFISVLDQNILQEILAAPSCDREYVKLFDLCFLV